MKQNELVKEDIAFILKNWGIEQFEYSLSLHGKDNKTIIIKTPEKSFALKIYQDNPIVNICIGFMNYLNRNAIPVPKIYSTTAQNYVTEVTFHDLTYQCILMDKIEGEHITEYTPDTIHEIGKGMAWLHLTSLTYPESQEYTPPDIIIEERIDEVNIDLIPDDKIRALFSEIHEFGIECPDMPHGFIHDDFNKSNLLFKDGKLSGILDFDDLKFSYFVQDVGGFLWNIFYSVVFKNADVSLLSHFVSSYEEIQPLSTEEKVLLKKFMLLRNYSFSVFEYIKGASMKDLEEYIVMQEKIENLDVSTLLASASEDTDHN